MILALYSAVVATVAMAVAFVLNARGRWTLENSKTLLEIAAIAAGAVWLVGHFGYELEMLGRRAAPTKMTIQSSVVTTDRGKYCRLAVDWGIANIGKRTFAIDQSTLEIRKYAPSQKEHGAYVETMSSVRRGEPVLPPFDAIADEPPQHDGKRHSVVEVDQSVGWHRVAMIPLEDFGESYLVGARMRLEDDEGEPWRVESIHRCERIFPTDPQRVHIENWPQDAGSSSGQ